MGWLRTLVVAGTALAISCANGLAADMPGSRPPPLPPPQYRAPLLELNSGWYLRGDLGGFWGRVDGAEMTAPLANPTDSSMGNGYTAGFGFGLKSRWLRTDITIDYATPTKYKGTIASADDTTAKVQPTAALLNGYLDLGTWYHIAAYIGGGAGLAYNRITDFATAVPVTGDSNKNQWNFAYAGMAGIAFPISHNMMMDVGYRYLNVGDVSTGGSASPAMTIKNVAAHEVRVGVRWSFDDFR